jgi:hypothetical protein
VASRNGKVGTLWADLADEVIVAGDLHGNRLNFQKLLEMAQLAEHAGKPLTSLHRGRRVLAIAAHPDDEVLGVGGTLIRHFKAGDEVIVIGFDLGMNTPGGFGQRIRIPSGWAVKRPTGLSLKESMTIGTAGFTAALCIDKLIACGLTTGGGPVLVTGATGSGKSTTLAAMIDKINTERSEHILTIEDPIEFVHQPKKALVNQREVGAHTESFAAALQSAGKSFDLQVGPDRGHSEHDSENDHADECHAVATEPLPGELLEGPRRNVALELIQTPATA